MPMIDYLCGSCGYRFENFYHSDAPESQHCPHLHCEGTAKKIYSLPGEYRPTNARRFAPIVVWVSNDNPDVVSVPGRPDEPVQTGYHAVELTSIADAERMTRHMDNVALRDAINQRAMEKEFFDERTKERRDAIRARIGNDPRKMALFKAACEYVDRKRDKRYSKTLDPRGHFQVFAYDQSNRMPYADAESGYRDRRS